MAGAVMEAMAMAVEAMGMAVAALEMEAAVGVPYPARARPPYPSYYD